MKTPKIHRTFLAIGLLFLALESSTAWRYKNQAHLLQRQLAARNVKSDQLTDAEIDNILRTLLEPGDNPSMQVQSLRRDVIKKMENAMEKQRLEDELSEYKRSIGSLARWNNLPGKRSLEALARAGYIKTLPDEEDYDDNMNMKNYDLKRNLEALARAGYIKTLQEEEDERENLKRSIAALAKTGQLPQIMMDGEQKRGIAELARNGELPNKREMQQLIEELYDKRNIGSLARYSNFPSYGKRFLGSLARNNDLYRYRQEKRNIAALARDGLKPHKRNVAALLRQDNFALNNDNQDFENDENLTQKPEDLDAEKRNLDSVKAQFQPKFKRDASSDQPKKNINANARNKRQVDYYDGLNEEYPQPVYQNQNIYDYEDLMRALTGEYPDTEKRFLGSVARSGWFRPQSSSRFVSSVSKRHIGSLARLGWLPSFRQARRFNRSGRSTNYYYDCSTDREASANGESQDDFFTQNAIPVDNKSFIPSSRLLQKNFFIHPRQTAKNWH